MTDFLESIFFVISRIIIVLAIIFGIIFVFFIVCCAFVFPLIYLEYSLSPTICVYDNNIKIYEGKSYNIDISSAGNSTKYIKKSVYFERIEEIVVSNAITVDNCRHGTRRTQ
jgi:hypothetical protein